ncbi:MAG: SIR2 family protein [Rhodospirillales bacterium]
MQFVKDGPDVPDRLIQAHEDGRVVFFCGAGISVPAGLPGFEGLVDELYAAVGENPTPVEQSAIRKGLYDTAIGLLEKRLGGSRARARSHLLKILKPEEQDCQTQQALLTLSRTRRRQPRCRLVTTNLDRLFEAVREPELPIFQAPCLPPAKTRWHGLVYLHGLLPDGTTGADAEAALDQLVLSSGDFGLAYLSEGWAARFVAELFQNFTVCFVGYSINDPVLRYMMDALAPTTCAARAGLLRPSPLQAILATRKRRRKRNGRRRM